MSAARSYELVVYQVEEKAGQTEPVIRKKLPATAYSWTPSMDHCLVRGVRYAWSVRAVRKTIVSDWSEPSLFQVADEPSQAELAAALEIVQEYFSARGNDLEPEGRETDIAAASPIPSPASRKAAAAASAPVATALSVDGAVAAAWFTVDCQGGGRYEDNGDGTVTDCRTGLVWLKDASCEDLGSDGNWEDMTAAAAGLADGTCGLTDGSQPGFWRLPTVSELMEMVASANIQGFDDPSLTNAKGDAKWTTDGDAFIGVEYSCCEYWTSSEIDTGSVWDVNMRTGNLDIDGKFERNWIWPVRSGLQTTTRTATGSPNAACSDSEMLVGGGCDCGSNAVRTSTAVENSWTCKCDGSPFNGNAAAICLVNP
ncbi:MAG: DUF1566 domain-containing protein [Thermoanaerobaculia bacterium]